MSSSCDISLPQGFDSSALLASSFVQQSKQSSGSYSNVEDVILSEAIINAPAENSVCGAHKMLCKVFKPHKFEIYVTLVKEQAACDKDLLEQCSWATYEEYTKKGVGGMYPHCSADSIYNHFKGQIALEV